MNIVKAEHIAEAWKIELEQWCEKIEIAGSVRRGKSDVKDIEIVVIPKKGFDIFGELTYEKNLIELEIATLKRTHRIDIKKNGPKYKKLWVRGHKIHIDLFLVIPPAQWGVIMAIRTGPADFSKWLVTPKKYGGAMPGYLKQKDGALWNGTTMIETPAEESYFKALGIDWIEPGDRQKYTEGKFKDHINVED